MNKQFEKKASISKRISLNNTIPQIINNKFVNESTTIVNEIIEKIISLVISTNFNKNIEKNISLSCYNFIKNTINSYLTSNFITHDKDETNQDTTVHTKDELIPEIEPISIKNDSSNIEGYNIYSQNNSTFQLDEKLFLNNICKGVNDWDIMEEPKSNEFDRYATTMIKFREIEKEKNFKYNQKGGEVLEEINEESEKNSVNNELNKEKNEPSPTKKDNKFYKFAITNNNKNNRKKNLLDMMNQFSFQDLDNNDDIYVEPKEINYETLRKEAQEKQNIVKEEKKIIKNANIEIENKMRAIAEKNRQYNGKKITLDANGQIVLIKGIKLDKLVKEFNLLKTSTKLIKDEEKEKEKKVKKKKRLSQEVIIKDNKEEADKNKNNEDKNQKLPKGSKVLPKIKNNKFRSSMKELLEENSKSRLAKKLEEGPIMPSGSNFELMNMEVGVTIKENEKIKTGGKDFYHKFNKYSIDNYNKQLKETTEMNSFLKSPTEIENPGTKSDMNYIGNLTDTYNTSTGFINNSNFNQLAINSKNYQISNYNTLSNFGNRTNRTKDLNSSLSPKLKLSIGNGSLLGSMEKLNLITERQERLAKKAENIFKKNISNYSSAKEIVLPKLEEINKFTSDILTSNNWMKKSGINNNFGSPFRNPGKPGFKEISREMGIRGKILRNRMKNNVEKQDINPALMAVDFFKNKI